VAKDRDWERSYSELVGLEPFVPPEVMPVTEAHT
jgi:hypothetical protein